MFPSLRDKQTEMSHRSTQGHDAGAGGWKEKVNATYTRRLSMLRQETVLANFQLTSDIIYWVRGCVGQWVWE